MNPRERILAVVLLAILVLAGGGAAVYQLYWKPLLNRGTALADMENRIAQKEQLVADLEARKAQLDRWRVLSLPSDVHLAWGDYQKLLSEMLVESGFSNGAMSVKHREPDLNVGARGKKQPFIKLHYELNGHGSMGSLVKLLEKFYKTPLLHQVKSLDIRKGTQRQDQKPDDLDLKLTIEALVVEKAQVRKTLLPEEKPTDIKTLAALPRRYADISARNVFLPPAPPPSEPTPPPPPKPAEDITRYVHLTDITQSDRKTEAFLYDRFNNRKTRLRATAGFDSFRIASSNDETLVKGQVLRIDDRDVIFKANDKYYRLHLDETLQDAMKKALSASEVKELKLSTAGQ